MAKKTVKIIFSHSILNFARHLKVPLEDLQFHPLKKSIKKGKQFQHFEHFYFMYFPSKPGRTLTLKHPQYRCKKVK